MMFKAWAATAAAVLLAGCADPLDIPAATEPGDCSALALEGIASRNEDGSYELLARLRNIGSTSLQVLRMIPTVTLRIGSIDANGTEIDQPYLAVPSVAPITSEDVLALEPTEHLQGSIRTRPLQAEGSGAGVLLSYDGGASSPFLAAPDPAADPCRVRLSVFFAWNAESGLTPTAGPPPVMKGATAEDPRGCLDLRLSAQVKERIEDAVILVANLTNRGTGPLVVVEPHPSSTVFVQSGRYPLEETSADASARSGQELRTAVLQAGVSLSVELRAPVPSNDTHSLWVLYTADTRNDGLSPHDGCEIRRLSAPIYREAYDVK